jgi:hypothetical protein
MDVQQVRAQVLKDPLALPAGHRSLRQLVQQHSRLHRLLEHYTVCRAATAALGAGQHCEHGVRHTNVACDAHGQAESTWAGREQPPKPHIVLVHSIPP